jgi:hypothetical protein
MEWRRLGYRELADDELTDLGPFRIGGARFQLEGLDQCPEWAIPAQLVGGTR